MNLEELRSVQRTERQKDSLQHLRDSFYRDVADYVEELKAERDRVAAEADDPFSSPEVGRLTDEIETAEEVVESLYERRVGKVVKRATFAAADMAAEEEGLTTEERELFDDLVARIKQNRESVLDTLAGNYADGDASATETNGDAGDASATETNGDAATDAADAPPTPPSDPDPARSTADADDGGLLAEVMGGDDAAADDAADGDAAADDAADGDAAADDAADGDAADGDAAESTASSAASADSVSDVGPTTDGGTATADAAVDADRTTVRITRDVGEIFGVDEREYDLEREDVVTLPTTNAEPLIDREAAEPLE